MIIFASVVGEVLNRRGYGIEHGFDTEAEAIAWIAETETQVAEMLQQEGCYFRITTTKEWCPALSDTLKKRA